jgi:hypothetical protein
MAVTARPGQHGREKAGQASRQGRRRRRAASGLPRGAAFALAILFAACSPTFNWREIHPAPGGFVVALPQRPQTEEREVGLGDPGSAGEFRVPMTMTSTGVGATLFAVGVAELPPGGPAPAQLLAWVRDGVVRNIRGTVVAERPIAAPPGSLTGLRAAEEVAARGTMAGDPRPTRLDARIYVFDDRLYSLTALSAEGELTPELLDTFFSSFRIVGHS